MTRFEASVLPWFGLPRSLPADSLHRAMERLLRVAINTWWEDDPAQRYWMQITDRDHLAGCCKPEAHASDMGL